MNTSNNMDAIALRAIADKIDGGASEWRYLTAEDGNFKDGDEVSCVSHEEWIHLSEYSGQIGRPIKDWLAFPLCRARRRVVKQSPPWAESIARQLLLETKVICLQNAWAHVSEKLRMAEEKMSRQLNTSWRTLASPWDDDHIIYSDDEYCQFRDFTWRHFTYTSPYIGKKWGDIKGVFPVVRVFQPPCGYPCTNVD